MSSTIQISRITRNLAGIFVNLTNEYIFNTFGSQALAVNVKFERCYIAICEDGDAATGRIGGIVGSWWEVNHSNVQEVSGPRFQSTGSDNDETPILKIYIEDNRFVLGERYCSELLCRRTGSISELEVAKSFQGFPLVWRSCSPT